MSFDLDIESYCTEDEKTGYIKLLEVSPLELTFRERLIDEAYLDDGLTTFMDSKTYKALVDGLLANGFNKK